MIVTHPATADRFEDVATLLGPKKPTSNVCWCLSHRLEGKVHTALRGTERRDHMRALTERDPAPGVLAYDGDEVVGWVALAPRGDLPVGRSRLVPHVDDQPVWSVICLRVRPGHRGRGIVHALLQGAVEYARANGAPVLEAYPTDNGGQRVDTTMAFVGTRAQFEAAGFTKAADTDAVAGGFPRVLMRRELG